MASGNIKNFELKLGKAGLIIVIVGFAALLCCSFLFGIAVGKNIDSYPETIASLPQRLLALVWRPAKIRAAQTASENKAAQNQPARPEELDLTFYNTLTSKKGVAKEQPIPDKKPAIEAPAVQKLLPQPQNDAGSTSVVSPDSEVKKQQGVAGNQKGDEIEAKIKEAELKSSDREPTFSVQVASLKEKTKAGQMSKKISALGYKPRIVENNIPGKGKWFRIVIDGFPNKTLAQAAAGKILSKTGTGCIVKRVDAPINNN
ncbi:MAG: SPOR domain-containing protein [Smithellaceae bacterium]